MKSRYKLALLAGAVLLAPALLFGTTIALQMAVPLAIVAVLGIILIAYFADLQLARETGAKAGSIDGIRSNLGGMNGSRRNDGEK